VAQVPSKHKDVKKEKPSVLGTLDSEMHEAGVTLFGAQSHANPLLDGFFGEVLPCNATCSDAKSCESLGVGTTENGP
jgi:hypothetical protein